MAETRAEQIARWEREGVCEHGVSSEQCVVCCAGMSVVDEDRLTRRNPDHLDDWRFR